MTNPTQPLDLERMREVALKATPGPWQNGIDDLEGVVAPYQGGLGNVICIPPLKRMYDSLEHWPDNAAFIATCNPASVLALLDALSSERAAREEAEREADSLRDRAIERTVRAETAEAQVDGLREGLNRLMAAERNAARTTRESLVADRFETPDRDEKAAAQTVAGRELTAAWEEARALLSQPPADEPAKEEG